MTEGPASAYETAAAVLALQLDRAGEAPTVEAVGELLGLRKAAAYHRLLLATAAGLLARTEDLRPRFKVDPAALTICPLCGRSTA